MTSSTEKVINLVANGATISSAILQTYSTSKIRFLLSDKVYNMPIVDAGLDDRIKNGLLRNRLTTCGEFIHAMSSKKQIRGMGNISLKRVFYKIVDMAWDYMNVTERAAFLLDIDAKNTIKQ